MTKTPRFKPGDKVRCVKTEKPRWLTVGTVYEVAEPQGISRGQVIGPSDGTRIGMSWGRFELVKAKILQTSEQHDRPTDHFGVSVDKPKIRVTKTLKKEVNFEVEIDYVERLVVENMKNKHPELAEFKHLKCEITASESGLAVCCEVSGEIVEDDHG